MPVLMSVLDKYPEARAEFVTALERHRDGENSLVLESVTTDIGAGD